MMPSDPLSGAIELIDRQLEKVGPDDDRAFRVYVEWYPVDVDDVAEDPEWAVEGFYRHYLGSFAGWEDFALDLADVHSQGHDGLAGLEQVLGPLDICFHIEELAEDLLLGGDVWEEDGIIHDHYGGRAWDYSHSEFPIESFVVDALRDGRIALDPWDYFDVRSVASDLAHHSDFDTPDGIHFFERL